MVVYNKIKYSHKFYNSITKNPIIHTNNLMLQAIGSSQSSKRPLITKQNQQNKYGRKNSKGNISNRIKGLVLIGSKNKFSRRQQSVRSVFQKWYSVTKADLIKRQVIVKILTQQKISEISFLYRIKAYCLKQQQELHKIHNQQKPKQSQPQVQKQLQKHSNFPQKSQPKSCILKSSKPPQASPSSKRSLNSLDKILQTPNSSSPCSPSPNSTHSALSLALRPTHLRSISEQPSMPPNSQKQFSQIDILDIFDKKINNIQKRIMVSGLRTVEILILKISYKRIRDGFTKICSHRPDNANMRKIL